MRFYSAGLQSLLGIAGHEALCNCTEVIQGLRHAATRRMLQTKRPCK